MAAIERDYDGDRCDYCGRVLPCGCIEWLAEHAEREETMERDYREMEAARWPY